MSRREITVLRLLKGFYGEDEEEVEMLHVKEIEGLLSGTVSKRGLERMLRRLEKLGLVESNVDEYGDRYYALTDHGLKVVNGLERLASEVKRVNELVLKKARFKLVRRGNRFRVVLT